MQRVSSRVHVETGHLGSNNSVIVTSEGTILVDAPHKPTDAMRWAQRVAELGEARYLVNTDHHPDHTIGNAWLPGRVVAHERTRARLVSEAPTKAYLRDLLGVIDPEAVPLLDTYEVRLPEIVFSDTLTLHLGEVELRLIHRPGHTANTIIAHCPQEGVVFTGDNVCEAGLPSFQDATVRDFFDALDAVEELDFDVLVPGHGEVGGREIIERYREQGRELVGRVAQAIEAGRSREEACAEIRFEDRIHRGTDAYVGYPEELIEHFQERSIAAVYDQLVAEPELAGR
jgi:glyoxylase-like metal-dependent hydrolase (beta-lactamase superfamily II)